MIKFKNPWSNKEIILQTEGLTENEVKIMQAIRTNHFSDILESGLEWSFAVCDTSGLNEKTYRGVASSLVKKGFIIIERQAGEQPTLELTEKGMNLYSDYTTNK